MEKEIYWLWLQECYGFAKRTVDIFLKFKDAKEIYEASNEKRREVFSVHTAKKMRETDLSKAKELYDFCVDHNIHVLTPESENYPKKLLQIENYPLVLYVRGDINCLNSEFSIAVIGSRIPSVYSEDVAAEIVKTLAEKGTLIVSGGALGIDSVAHTAAIDYGGKTVLVMGVGHGSDYLPENSFLRKRVASNGALVTEYPPLFSYTKGTFPQRNRIISGISDGVVIIEAAERSGTLSTANHAKKQNRKLLVLPGDVKSGNFAGSNQLITDGAAAVFSGDDILSSFGYKTSEKRVQREKVDNPFYDVDTLSSFAKGNPFKNQGKKLSKKNAKEVTEKIEEKPEEIIKKIPDNISKNAEMVYNVMSEGACELDMIKRNASLQVRHVLVALTELEMLGVVSMDGPNTYKIN